MNVPSWMPLKQHNGFKLLQTLNSLGVADIWYDSPEDNQVQVQINIDVDNGISFEELQFLKEKTNPNSMEIRTFYDDDNKKDRTVLEMIYSKEDEEK